jgi:uncharacterized membrane protein
MKNRKGWWAIAALLAALLLAVFLLPVMTGLITQRQMDVRPAVTATPIPEPEEYEDGGL